MLRFFRNIRQKLATENLPDRQAGKVMAYLRYAIGEIVLVVVGILIALQVNNWNETRKNNAEFKITIKALQQDLRRNIVYANSVIKNAYDKDSIITLVFDKNVTREMYWKNRNLRNVIMRFRYYSPVQDNLLTALSFENCVPNVFKPLIPYLKFLKTQFERWDYTYKSSTQNIKNYNQWLADNFYWFSQDDSLAIESNIDYLLRDPIYLNKVYLFRFDYLSNNINNIILLRNQSAGILAKLDQIEKNNPNSDLNALFEQLGLHPYKQVSNTIGIETKSKIQFRTQSLWYNATNQTINIFRINNDLQRFYQETLKPGDFLTPGIPDEQLVEVVYENQDSQIYQSVVDGYLLID